MADMSQRYGHHVWPRVEGLRTLELGTPGEMRTDIIDVVVSRIKTATTGLLHTGYVDEAEEVEHPGERLALVDNEGRSVATLEVLSALVMRSKEVSLEHVIAQGEGWTTLEACRSDFISFLAAEETEVHDDTKVVCISFKVPTGTAALRASELPGLNPLVGPLPPTRGTVRP